MLFLSVKVTRSLLVLGAVVALPLSLDAWVAGSLVTSGALVGSGVLVGFGDNAAQARLLTTTIERNANR